MFKSPERVLYVGVGAVALFHIWQLLIIGEGFIGADVFWPRGENMVSWIQIAAYSVCLICFSIWARSVIRSRETRWLPFAMVGATFAMSIIDGLIVVFFR